MLISRYFNFQTLSSLTFICSLLLFFNIRFETNDDITMLLISSGVISGTPDEHLVFIGIPIGLFLKFLYELAPDIEHYTVFFILLHSFSTLLIISSIAHNIENDLLKKSLFFLFFAVEGNLFINLQFTTTSAIVSIASLSQLYQASYRKRLLGFLLFAIAFCLRYHSAVLVFILSLPFFIFHFNFEIRKLALLIIPILIISCTLYAFNNLYNNLDEEWAHYQDFNSSRGKINDNPNYYKYRGHSEKEMINFILIRNFIPDIKQTNVPELTSILEEIKTNSWRAKATNVYPQITPYFKIIIFLFLMGFVVFSMTSKKMSVMWVFTLLLFFAIITIIAAEATLKPRVVNSAILPILFITLPYVFAQIAKPSFVKYPLFLIILLGTFFTVELFQTNKYHIEEKANFLNQTALIEKYVKENRNPILLMPGAFNSEFIYPMKITHYFRNKNIILMGWITGIPFQNQITTHTQLIDDTAIFIHQDQMRKLVPIIVRGIELNYNIKVSVKVMMSLGDNAIIALKKVN
jgi:hypothetical protein